MALELTPELGVELTPDVDVLDLRDRAEALCRSVELLEKNGLDFETTPQDQSVAAQLTSAYASAPQETSKKVTTARAASLTPASLRNIRTYLDEYGRVVVNHAVELRHFVTNRLLEESQNPDPRIRIRALELLGKHSDVGLFTEKQEVTITHQTTDELKDRLRSKLQKLMRKDEPIEDAVVIDGEILDVSEELGLSAPKPAQNTPETQETVETEQDFDD